MKGKSTRPILNQGFIAKETACFQTRQQWARGLNNKGEFSGPLSLIFTLAQRVLQQGSSVGVGRREVTEIPHETHSRGPH
jgi:hypothetical protein